MIIQKTIAFYIWEKKLVQKMKLGKNYNIHEWFPYDLLGEMCFNLMPLF